MGAPLLEAESPPVSENSGERFELGVYARENVSDTVSGISDATYEDQCVMVPNRGGSRLDA